ncbi:hypothetical protein FB472_2265 [Rhodoglobus vestalii]|uniref:Uncharacterized protein n=1 Tax=Rhodoglobus vestalii TaxID=193384 RepID=A0A8H2KCE1_9MICO|nr:hypothetical protein [Rhodoglobus vestalii]TQO20626.1 hypothetical protein FB472_2265 [Rhodoglobus vestalii]
MSAATPELAAKIVELQQRRKGIRVMTAKQTYANTVFYATPSRLEALRGPASGVIELPRSLY